MPRGIRRSEPTHPPAGSVIGSDTIMAPLAPDPKDPQVIHGTSNEAMTKASGIYKDEASVAKPETKLVNAKTPFALK